RCAGVEYTRPSSSHGSVVGPIPIGRRDHVLVACPSGVDHWQTGGRSIEGPIFSGRIRENKSQSCDIYVVPHERILALLEQREIGRIFLQLLQNGETVRSNRVRSIVA